MIFKDILPFGWDLFFLSTSVTMFHISSLLYFYGQFTHFKMSFIIIMSFSKVCTFFKQFSTKHEWGRNIPQPCLDISLFLSVWLDLSHQLPGGRRHHQEELCLGQNEGYQTARDRLKAHHTRSQ